MDVFFTKEWANIFAEKEGETAGFFEMIDGDKIMSYSFIKREINKMSFATKLSEKYFDIISPYGYGGIYMSEAVSSDSNFIRKFISIFNDYCMDNNIVSEFIRFHPLQKNYKFFANVYSLRHVNDNVYINLKQTEKEISQNIAKRHRYCIRKAIAKGVNIKFDNNFEDIDKFIKLYEGTNDKNKASDFYYFKKDFFSSLKKSFGNKIKLVTASIDDKIVSASLFIFNEKEVYYFLSGTNKLGYNVFACHLLLHEVILKAKNDGKESFNLGGGLAINDNLFLFKSGFSNLVAPYYIGTAVRLPDVYKKLLDMSKVNLEIDYFPKYRYKF